ncbi:hypothetical protein DRO33_00560 [Candidatus Bathyarchaeota archaeon]|nr:MAG: hypothetical protein DRO33_00560 [Candidatus Bathyarchaeota archaeon]
MGEVIQRALVPVGRDELSTVAVKAARGELLEGPDASELGRELGRYVGGGRTFTFNFCRTALLVALRCLGLEKGDEVLVPAYTCSIVFEVVLRAGLRPVLVDADPLTYNVSSEALRKAVGPRTKALLVAHMFGSPCEMGLVAELAEEKGLYVIEDVAQALGAEYKGRKLGTFGDLAAFSFGPGKNITGGNGGVLIVNNPDLLERAEELWARTPEPTWLDVREAVGNLLALRALRDRRLYALAVGAVERWIDARDLAICRNCLVLAGRARGRLAPTVREAKMPDVCAAVARVQLRKLDAFNKRRIENAEAMMAVLSGSGLCELPRAPKGSRSVFTRFVVKVPKGLRAVLRRKLLRRGIDTDRPYWYLSGLLGTFGRFPVAHDLAERLLALPNSPNVRKTEAAWVAEELAGLLRRLKGSGGA